MKLKAQYLRHRRYPTKEVAQIALSNANMKHKILLVRVYECDFCRGWHLTSKHSHT